MVREVLTLEKLQALGPAEAAALFITRRADGWTEAERELHSRWLASDARNLRAFEDAELAWRSFENADGDELLLAMRKHATAPRKRAAPRWLPLAAAATLIVAVGLAWILTPQAETFEHATARGEIRALELPDGTGLSLDAESTVTGRFDARRRGVELLRGRAAFDVAADESRPFSVSVAGRRVVAVGTRFEVNLLARGLTVTLHEGRVNVERLDASSAPVTLAAGQQYVELGGKAEVRQLATSAEGVPSWQQGFIEFDDLPLGDAAQIMNRYSAEKIVIDSTSVSSLRVSGQFRAGDSVRFAQTLAEMHGLRMVRQGDRIELLRP